MVIEEHARLEVTLPDGRNYNITETDIVGDSLSVSGQCVNGNAFAFGCVAPAQMSVRFRIRDKVGRYDVYGAVITLYRWFGAVPPANGGKSGVFNVTSVSKQHDIFTISASDNICWLDASAFEENDGNVIGNTVYRRLGEGGAMWNAAEAIGCIVELTGLSYYYSGIMSNIPNGSAEFTGYGIPDAEKGTYRIRNVLLLDDEHSDNMRDYIAWLAEYMGGFVVADQNGSIQFRLFQNAFDTVPAVLNASDFQLDSLEIAGFRIYLYKSKIITEDNSFWSNQFSVTTDANIINTEMVIQGNPFIEFIYQYNKQFQAENLMPIPTALLFYQNHIPIRPFSGTYHGAQYLQLGQYIRIIAEDGSVCDTIITNISWKFRGGQQIRCVGEDSRTLSQARRRTQAVRIGERLRTQITRLSDRVNALENGG